MTVRFLVIDGYSKEGRNDLQAGGASLAADLYARMITRILPDAQCVTLFPSDDDAELPDGVGLEQFDGIAWTGCSLTVFEDDPRVHRQIGIARAAFERGIPSFGTCWGLQIAVFAAGGIVRPHPHGREMGIARKIQLTPEGRGHPLYAGKPSVFDGFISHVDEVTHLPPGAVHLAGNPFTRVQAATVTDGKGTFWGLQYHPEYDLHEIARLTHCRIDKLVQGGFFSGRNAALAYIDTLEALHQNPQRKDLAWRLGVDADVMDETVRVCEVRNWIFRLVLPSLKQ
ncbi:type 1 glutamine amidotransferase [Myxococcota bacterium]